MAKDGSPEQHQGTRRRRRDAAHGVLACVGDNCVDEYLAPINRRFAAGNAINVAVGLLRAGFAVDYFGAVGDDMAGLQIVAALVRAGVGVDHVYRLHGPTSLTEIRLDAGERRFTGFVEGAAERYVPSRADLADLRRQAPGSRREPGGSGASLLLSPRRPAYTSATTSTTDGT